MAVIPIQAATMGYIPGSPFSIAVHGLLRAGRGGGRTKKVRLRDLGEFEIEQRDRPFIDVSHLEVLISAISGDITSLRQRIINEEELRSVEEEILALLELIELQ